MDAARQAAYWRSTLRIVGAILAAWLAVSFVAGIALADALDHVRVAGFPLGFWFGQQGAEVAFVLLVAAYVAATNRLERRHGVYED
jgi:putative solute:sodium symporter small subunit